MPQQTAAPRPHTEEEPQQSRGEAMAALFLAGHTLQEIGDRYRLTRERVRQLINEESGTRVPELRRRRRALEQQQRLTELEQLHAGALRWSEQHPGESLEDGARHLDATVEDLRLVLGKRAAMHLPNRHRGVPLRWSDEELLEMLRDCAEELGDFTHEDFNRWSAGRGGPTHQTPTNRFGGWLSALREAGLSTVGTSVRSDRAHEERDLWAAVVEFIATSDSTTSFKSYDRWSRGVGAPSGALVRIRLGITWSEIRERALRAVFAPETCDAAWLADVTRRRNWGRLSAEKSAIDVGDATALVDRASRELGEDPLRLASYNRWARQAGYPSSSSLMVHTGSRWSELVAAAGGRASFRHRWSRGEMLDALALFLDGSGADTLESYQVWRQEHRGPSYPLLLREFGGWGEALDGARLDRVAGAGG